MGGGEQRSTLIADLRVGDGDTPPATSVSALCYRFRYRFGGTEMGYAVKKRKPVVRRRLRGPRPANRAGPAPVAPVDDEDTARRSRDDAGRGSCGTGGSRPERVGCARR